MVNQILTWVVVGKKELISNQSLREKKVDMNLFSFESWDRKKTGLTRNSFGRKFSVVEKPFSDVIEIFLLRKDFFVFLCCQSQPRWGLGTEFAEISSLWLFKWCCSRLLFESSRNSYVTLKVRLGQVGMSMNRITFQMPHPTICKSYRQFCYSSGSLFE